MTETLPVRQPPVTNPDTVAAAAINESASSPVGAPTDLRRKAWLAQDRPDPTTLERTCRDRDRYR